MKSIRSNRLGIMEPSSGNDLQDYNALILQYQEDAFNLACFLLDDEDLATDLIDSVLRSGFPEFKQSHQDFNLWLTGLVIDHCMAKVKFIQGPAPIRPILLPLTEEQKIIVILIDCFEMSYQSTAVILQKPVSDIRKTLAAARFNLNLARDNVS